MGVTHELKCWQAFFEEMLSGRRTFDMRRDDRGYKVGDILVQREFVADNEPVIGSRLDRLLALAEVRPAGPGRMTKTLGDRSTKVGGAYTGRELRYLVRHIMRGPQLGLESGWVVMAVVPTTKV